jgi:hypothetical protein
MVVAWTVVLCLQACMWMGEYAAKEQAAIEERLKRKAVMMGGGWVLYSNGGMIAAWKLVPFLQVCMWMGDYAAKEQAAIEERLKRKAVMVGGRHDWLYIGCCSAWTVVLCSACK